jgi:hypothetical protein
MCNLYSLTLKPERESNRALKLFAVGRRELVVGVGHRRTTAKARERSKNEKIPARMRALPEKKPRARGT